MKTRGLFLSACLLCLQMGVGAAVPGDIDGNGTVGTEDMDVLLGYLDGMVMLRADQVAAADLDNNGQVDNADVQVLIQKLNAARVPTGTRHFDAQTQTSRTAATRRFDAQTQTSRTASSSRFRDQVVTNIPHLLTGTSMEFGQAAYHKGDLIGQLYFLKPTGCLPDLSVLQPVAELFIQKLNIPRTNFKRGFPGVSQRLEWFAVRYRGKLWSPIERNLVFKLISDDGSKLYINGHLVIDNDGPHTFRAREGLAHLHRGMNTVQVDYYQGPMFEIGLQLFYNDPGQPQRVLNTADFAPPGQVDDINRLDEQNAYGAW